MIAVASCSEPTPTPSIKRPSEKRSRVAASLAVSNSAVAPSVAVIEFRAAFQGSVRNFPGRATWQKLIPEMADHCALAAGLRVAGRRSAFQLHPVSIGQSNGLPNRRQWRSGSVFSATRTLAYRRLGTWAAGSSQRRLISASR
jgi:hypothetical protein